MLHLAKSVHDFENSTVEELKAHTNILKNLTARNKFFGAVLKAQAVKMNFDTKIRHLYKSVDTVQDIFGQLMNQHLSPKIIDLIPHLPSEFDKYLKKIDDAGYEAAATTFRHLYQIDTSYLIEKSEINNFIITAFVHVPITQKGNLYKVFTYIPSIMPFSHKMKHGLKVTEGSQGNTIAINEEGKKFVTFDSRKLQDCKQVASFKICENFDSTWALNTIEESCLGVLYTLRSDKILKNCPTAPVKLEKEVKKLDKNKWLLFSPTPAKVTWRCSDAQNFRTFKEMLVFKYQIFHMNKNCHAKFGKHHFSTSATINQDHIEANIEFKPIMHKIPNDFSVGLVNDEKLEEMFKIVDQLEKEAPKSIKRAEEIIKDMEKYQFAGDESFQSFWNAYSHIIVFIFILLSLIFFLYWLKQHLYIKDEISKIH